MLLFEILGKRNCGELERIAVRKQFYVKIVLSSQITALTVLVTQSASGSVDVNANEKKIRRFRAVLCVARNPPIVIIMYLSQCVYFVGVFLILYVYLFLLLFLYFCIYICSFCGCIFVLIYFYLYILLVYFCLCICIFFVMGDLRELSIVWRGILQPHPVMK